jgi:hypothetical protein
MKQHDASRLLYLELSNAQLFCHKHDILFCSHLFLVITYLMHFVSEYARAFIGFFKGKKANPGSLAPVDPDRSYGYNWILVDPSGSYWILMNPIGS